MNEIQILNSTGFIEKFSFRFFPTFYLIGKKLFQQLELLSFYLVSNYIRINFLRIRLGFQLGMCVCDDAQKTR